MNFFQLMNYYIRNDSKKQILILNLMELLTFVNCKDKINLFYIIKTSHLGNNHKYL